MAKTALYVTGLIVVILLLATSKIVNGVTQ